jgi:hypothetical protein
LAPRADSSSHPLTPARSWSRGCGTAGHKRFIQSQAEHPDIQAPAPWKEKNDAADLQPPPLAPVNPTRW